MLLSDMIFVGGVVLAFASLMAAMAYGVRQTWGLALIPDRPTIKAQPQEETRPVTTAAKSSSGVTP